MPGKSLTGSAERPPRPASSPPARARAWPAISSVPPVTQGLRPLTPSSPPSVGRQLVQHCVDLLVRELNLSLPQRLRAGVQSSASNVSHLRVLRRVQARHQCLGLLRVGGAQVGERGNLKLVQPLASEHSASGLSVADRAERWARLTLVCAAYCQRTARRRSQCSGASRRRTSCRRR